MDRELLDGRLTVGVSGLYGDHDGEVPRAGWSTRNRIGIGVVSNAVRQPGHGDRRRNRRIRHGWLNLLNRLPQRHLLIRNWFQNRRSRVDDGDGEGLFGLVARGIGDNHGHGVLTSGGWRARDGPGFWVEAETSRQADDRHGVARIVADYLDICDRIALLYRLIVDGLDLRSSGIADRDGEVNVGGVSGCIGCQDAHWVSARGGWRAGNRVGSGVILNAFWQANYGNLGIGVIRLDNDIFNGAAGSNGLVTDLVQRWALGIGDGDGRGIDSLVARFVDRGHGHGVGARLGRGTGD